MRIVYLWLGGLVFFAICAGATGYWQSKAIVDRAYYDSYYVVAYFRYALSICVIFAVFAAIYAAIHKWTIRTVPFWVAVMQFTLMFVGLNLIFLPQHLLGITTPRRNIDYLDTLTFWGQVSGYGILFSLISLILFAAIVLYLIFWWREKSPFNSTFE